MAPPGCRRSFRERGIDQPRNSANIARYLNSILIGSKFITASGERCWRAGSLPVPEDRAEAAREFEQELQLDPGNANAIYELAEIHRRMNELDQAQQLFEAALKYYPDFQQAQVGLATTLMAQRKPDLALPHLQRAVALDADDEVAWYRLSLADRALGNTEEQKKALAQFQRLRSQIALQQGTSEPAEVTKQTLEKGEVQ